MFSASFYHMFYTGFIILLSILVASIPVVDQGDAVPSSRTDDGPTNHPPTMEAHRIDVVETQPDGSENGAASSSSRKRSRNPLQHKSALAKEALYKGIAYTNKEGKLRPAPQMRLACVCRMKCSLKVSEEQRRGIFEIYTSKLGSKERQWAFIRAHSSNEPVKKHTTQGTPKKEKKFSRKYFFVLPSIDGNEKEKVMVCKTMFINTLAIWDGVIVSAWNHINQETGTPTPDKRGRHANRPRATTEEIKQSVRAHINSYPRIPSHYVRAKSKREYLQHGLNGAKMYRHYRLWVESENIPVSGRASKYQYAEIFNSEFNIGFFMPKKDRCLLCTKSHTFTEQERQTIAAQVEQHKINKEGAYEELRKSRELVTKRADVAMLCFDLQKVLPCPKSETSVFFYKNKLSVYNLTVYNNRRHQGTCYLWHAGTAKRGANEIGTALRLALSDLARQGIKEVQSFSDSCAGQNKNRFVYAMLLLVSASCGITIRHCFLEPGHTYNDADSVHAQIERASDRKDIYDLNEWIDVIQTAKVSEPMYDVKVLQRNDFLDFKDLVSKQNWDKATNGEKISWNKVKVVEASSEALGILTFQYEYGGERLTLDTTQRRGQSVNLVTYKPPRAYLNKIPLKQKAIKDLQELMKTKAIPSQYHYFYNNVINDVEPIDADDDPDDPQVVSDSVDPNCLVDDLGTVPQDITEAGDIACDNDFEEDNDDENFGVWSLSDE